MKTILVATDFSESSVNAVRFAADLAMAVEADLSLYTALPSREVIVAENIDELDDNDTDEALEKLDILNDQMQEYTNHRVSVATQLKYGDIDNIVKDVCRKTQPYAVVMAATTKTPMDRFLLGSQTLAVSHKIHVPLLLIPAGATFKGFKKIAIATDLEDVIDTPLESLTHWIQPFHPGLQLLYVNNDSRLHVSNVSEAVALQKHFKEFYPAFQYIQDDDVMQGIHHYLTENKTDLVIIVPKKHSLFHKSITKEFVLHADVPTLIFTHE